MRSTFRGWGGKLRTFATVCSGIDNVAGVLANWSKLLGAGLQHVFACEKDPAKQEYISKNSRPLYLFGDIRSLVNATATEGLPVHTRRTPVPTDVDLLIAGVSCKDLSNLNWQRKAMGNVLKRRCGSIEVKFE